MPGDSNPKIPTLFCASFSLNAREKRALEIPFGRGMRVALVIAPAQIPRASNSQVLQTSQDLPLDPTIKEPALILGIRHFFPGKILLSILAASSKESTWYPDTIQARPPRQGLPGPGPLEVSQHSSTACLIAFTSCSSCLTRS